MLRFASGSQVAHGFGWLDGTGRVLSERPVELWITCRMTHVFALGLLAGDDPVPGGPDATRLASLVAHGVASLRGALHDSRDGGWFAAVGPDGAPEDDSKQAYGHAFVVLAASSAHVAGIPGADALLDEALEVVTTRFLDAETGLVADVWDRGWTHLDPYRGINANMHTVEAFLAAGDATGQAQWHERAQRIGQRVAGWAATRQWRVPEHFDPTWSPRPEHNRDRPDDPFRPYGATVGHGLEWSRLLLTLGSSPATPTTPGLREAATGLYDRAVADGWAADGADGFVYTTDWSGRPVVRTRLHWVVAEAVAAANALYLVTGEERYAADRDRWWDYAHRHLVAPDGGSWQHELDTANRPASTIWPGRPDTYHAYQATLCEDLPLAPSFAAAVRDRGDAQRS